MKVDRSVNRVLKNIKFENQISEVKINSDQYYNAIEKHGIGKQLNKIIDSFKEDTVKESNLYKKLDLNIGIICDEFMYYALKDTANFIYIPFTENMTVNKNIDVLLVVTSWRGLDHSWDYVANPNGRVRTALLNLIAMYKEENIKTIFYSKEDPVSYQQYLSIAKECDFIFTSANEMIEEYIKDTGNKNVDYLEFGINPIYHNPIGKNLTDKRLSNIVTFAGSWMVRFPRRNDEAIEIFKGVHKAGYGLSIIDRQYERKMERYHFPSYLIKNISPTIPHERLMRLHKATKWGINLNSVQDSKTMFANRVYELQAMGNVIISNYNKGVQRKFPNILLLNSAKDVEMTLRELPAKEQKRLIAEGISNVMLNHTSFHRMEKMFNMLGIKHEIKAPNILVIGEGYEAEKSFEKQEYQNKNFIKSSDFNNDVSIVDKYDYITYFSNKIDYGEYYLKNLLSTFAYTNADIVTMNQDNYKYTDKSNYIKSASMIISKSFKYIHEDNEKLRYFNIPRTEMEVFNNQHSELAEEKFDLAIIIPLEDDDYQYLESKTLINLSNIDADIKLITYGYLSFKNSTVIERLKNKFSNLTHYHSSESKNIAQGLNKAINLTHQKYTMFLSPGNQLSKYHVSKFIKNINEYHNDLIIANTNDVVNNNESNLVQNDARSLLTEKNMSIESSIYSTKFIKNNNIMFDENINLKNDLFIYKALLFSPSISNYNGYFNNTLEIEELSNVSSIKILEEYEKIEQEKFNILIEAGTVNEYAINTFPTVFLNRYLPLLSNSSKEEKGKALVILQSIVNYYINYYDGNNQKLNEIIDLLFG